MNMSQRFILYTAVVTKTWPDLASDMCFFFAFEYQDAKHPTSNIQTWGMGIIHHKAWNHIFLLSIMSSKVLFPYKSIPYRNVFPVHSSRKFF